jgi:hypothetical protein
MEVHVETAQATLEVRNREFPIDERVPRHWHGGRKSVTSFFDNLSIFFPAGERFFIQAVKAHQKRIRDPQLLAEVAAFCAQEGIHGREHIRYNALLEQQGYPAVELERRVQRILAFVMKRLPKRIQLSATCSLEHFTALMAEFILSDPKLLEGADPTMRALWRWHSAEESEHRAVAWEVYRAARGPYLERAGTMVVATVIFWSLIVQHQWRFMKVDGTHWSLREWRALFVFLFVEPGGMPRLWRRWLDYFRPSFHPWDSDTRHLLEQWKEEQEALA